MSHEPKPRYYICKPTPDIEPCECDCCDTIMDQAYSGLRFGWRFFQFCQVCHETLVGQTIETLPDDDEE